MSRRHKQSMPREVLAATPASNVSNPMLPPVAARLQTVPAAESPGDPNLRKALQHAAMGQFEKAMSLLALSKSSPEILNARGVCLLRLGRIEDAIRLYRGLVLQSGATYAKPNVPMLYQINFATALFLNGSPSGCLSLLADMRQDTHPGVIRLRRAIDKWQSMLTFAQKLNWWFGRLEPPHCRPTIDFPAGDFEESEILSSGQTELETPVTGNGQGTPS